MHRLPVADDLVGGPGLHAGQVGAGVDLVDHHLHVDRVAGVGVPGLLVVAEHAELDIAPAAAVQGELLVAAVAGGVEHSLPGVRDGAAVGHEVVLDVVVLSCFHLRFGEVAARVDAEGMGDRHVVAFRQLGAEGVARPSDREILAAAARVGRRLNGGVAGDRTGLGTRGVGDVVTQAVVVPRQDETRADRPWRKNARPVEGLSEVVGEAHLDHRMAVGGDVDALDLDVEAGSDVLQLIGGEVVLGLTLGVELMGIEIDPRGGAAAGGPGRHGYDGRSCGREHQHAFRDRDHFPASLLPSGAFR